MNISRISCSGIIKVHTYGSIVARYYPPNPTDVYEDIAMTYGHSLCVLVRRTLIRVWSERRRTWIDAKEFPDLPWSPMP